MQVMVIGAGRMGELRVEDLAADPRVSRVLVANRTHERAEALAERFGAVAVPLDEAFEASVDAFALTTATDVKGDQLRAILERRLPVLCEKPLAADLAQTSALIEAAARQGVPIQVGFQRRFDPGLSAIKERIDSGGMGTLYAMHLVSHDRQPSRREFIAGSGGMFRDLCVHDFDVVRWLTGSEVVTVLATGQVRAHEDYRDFDDVDTALMHLVTESGVQVSVSGTRHDPVGHDVHLEVFGSGDSMAAGWTARTPMHLADGDLVVNVDPYSGFVDRFREAFRIECRAFVSMVAGERENPCPPESARQAMRIAVACETSLRENRVVRMDEVEES